MCGRYVSPDERSLTSWLRSLPQRNIRRQLAEQKGDFNVSPTRAVPAVRLQGEGLEVLPLRWGLVPFFAHGKPGPYSTFNARIEGIIDGPEKKSPSFRGPWSRGQRCILPASGFYEWHVNEDGTKQPFYITCADQPIFGFAGLWEKSAAEDGTAIESATIITMPANPMMAEIHNAKARMPAILADADLEAWLAGTAEQATAALRQYPQDVMTAWPVSSRVSSSRNQGPELIMRE